jgi:hypothetical protein
LEDKVMSLSLAASNLASAALAKILPVLQAKSVELATAAGSLLIAGGAVLGLHAATHWDDAKKIVAKNQQAKMQLAVRRQTVQRQERRLRIAGQKYQSEHSGTAPVPQGIYQHVTVSSRALLVDMAAVLDVPFASIGERTRRRLTELLDPGLEVGNPLDVWGSGRESENVFAGSLVALADDDAVDVVVLAVDLVPEYDGDDSYRDAAVAAWRASEIPMCVLSHVPSALDREAARRLRSEGIPVLEGTRSGLLAIRHLLEWRDHSGRPRVEAPRVDPVRKARWLGRLRAHQPGVLDGFVLLSDYGIASPPCACVSSVDEALAAAGRIGYPVVLKTATRAHKSDVAGVVLDLRSARELAAAYHDLGRRLGPEATVAAMAPPAVELALGIVHDPLLGPLVVVGAGGTLVELARDRAVALPPLDRASAARLLDSLRVRPLLDGYRGRAAVDMGAVLDAIVAVSSMAVELEGVLAALDVNPLSCTPSGVLALDVLVETRPAHQARALPGGPPSP